VLVGVLDIVVVKGGPGEAYSLCCFIVVKEPLNLEEKDSKKGSIRSRFNLRSD